jgi:hypothetical protein
MYTHVVHTALTALNCTSITDTRGTASLRWFVNGSRECFTGSHILLGLLSIVVLVGAGALVPLCILLSVGHPDKFPKSVRSFQEALRLPYKERLRWWSAVDLARRLVFLILVVLLPDNEVVSVLLLAVFTTIYAYVRPYKSTFSNLVESAVNVDFLLLLVLNTTAFFREDYLTFPPSAQSGPDCSDSIATVTWILMPFYYLPLAAFCVTLLSSLLLCIWRRQRRQSASPGEDDRELMLRDATGVGSGVEYTQQWNMELTTDGFLHLQTPQDDD